MDDAIFQRFTTLNIYRRGDRRAPHKPLLILIAIAHLQQGHLRLTYKEIEQALIPLLNCAVCTARPFEHRCADLAPVHYLASRS